MPIDPNNAHDVWNKLLTSKRLGRNTTPGYEDVDRDDFESDYDRIVFSNAFRHLQDKTQVFPLSKNDNTRTRLTHSIEVSCVGRSLGQKVQQILKKKHQLPANSSDEQTPDVPTIVAAACLAHDIGNPPFGHSGEAAIQEWAKKNVAADGKPKFLVETSQQARDLHEFEGNAQAIRVLSRKKAITSVAVEPAASPC